MAFYHWAGPAMKATVEGKQKAREDEQTSRLREIQMQQILESIAGAKQGREFDASRFGWETEDRPMMRDITKTKLDSALQDITKGGLEIEGMRRKNEIEAALQPGMLEYGKLDLAGKTKQAQFDSEKWSNPAYVNSIKEEWRKAGLSNREIETRIAENRAQTAAAYKNAETNRLRLTKEFAPQNLKQSLDAASLELAIAQGSGDQAKIDAAQRKVNSLAEAMDFMARATKGKLDGAPEKTDDLTNENIIALRNQALQIQKDRLAKQKEKDKEYDESWNPWAQKESVGATDINSIVDELLENQLNIKNKISGAGAAPYVKESDQQAIREVTRGGGDENIERVKRQMAAGASAGTGQAASPVSQLTQAFTTGASQMAGVNPREIASVPPEILALANPADVQMAQQMVNESRSQAAGSMSGMEIPVLTLADALTIIVMSRRQLPTGPSQVEGVGATSSVPTFSQGFGAVR